MALLSVPDDQLKMLRETLCISQSAMNMMALGRSPADNKRLQALIDQIDVLRPLGSDGKHDDRHTGFCGCDV